MSAAQKGRKINIAFLLPSLANKGPIIVVRDLVNELVGREGINIIVYYLDDLVELDFDCKCKKIKSVKEIQTDKYDVIHSHMLRPDVFLGLKKMTKPNIKIISTLHSYMDKDLANSYGKVVSIVAARVWRFFLRRFDKVICLSNDMKNYYQKRNLKNLDYIYNARANAEVASNISPIDLTAINQLKSQFTVIGAIGNVTKIKGFEQILLHLQQSPNYAVVIIGEGDERKPLMELAQKLNITDRCLFLGYKQNAREYLHLFDIYAMTSRSEGFPLVLLEAASIGLPTVCSELPIFREIFTQGEVVYFELDNIAALTEAFNKLNSSKPWFSENIKKAFVKNYSIRKMADCYLDAYSSLLN